MTNKIAIKITKNDNTSPNFNFRVNSNKKFYIQKWNIMCYLTLLKITLHNYTFKYTFKSQYTFKIMKIINVTWRQS